jgi:hypothetical protein
MKMLYKNIISSKNVVFLTTLTDLSVGLGLHAHVLSFSFDGSYLLPANHLLIKKESVFMENLI